MNILECLLGRQPECAGHDYGPYYEFWNETDVNCVSSIPTHIQGKTLQLQPTQTATCQRDGCREQKRRADSVNYYVPLECLASFEEKEKFRFMYEAAQLYDHMDVEADIREYRLRLLDIMESDE